MTAAKNVAVLLGPLIDGPPVIGTNNRDRAEECERWLGKESPPMTMKGGTLKL